MKRKKIRYGIANNGKEAVENWKTGGFHLILVRLFSLSRSRTDLPLLDGHPNANHGRNRSYQGDPTTGKTELSCWVPTNDPFPIIP